MTDPKPTDADDAPDDEQLEPANDPVEDPDSETAAGTEPTEEGNP